MIDRRTLHSPLLLATLTLAGCGDDGQTSAGSETTQSSITGVTVTGPTTPTSSTGASTSGDDASASGDTSAQPTAGDTSGTTGDSAPILDIGSPDSGFETTDTAAADGCVAVDLVFVIDNSVSMGDYQNALSLAFPGFADAIFETLPPGTNLHVGVTSTTMGPSNSGSTTNCVATGDDMKPQDAFYETPDMSDNGINGGQGRLYEPANGVHFYDINTDGVAHYGLYPDWIEDLRKDKPFQLEDKLEQLFLIGEEKIDASAGDHLSETVFAPGDADAFAEREGYFPSCLMGNFDCLHHRRSRFFRPEQIAFEE